MIYGSLSTLTLGAGVAKKLGVGKAIDETLIGGGAAMGSRVDNAVVFMGLLGTVEWAADTGVRLIGTIGFAIDCPTGFITRCIGFGND